MPVADAGAEHIHPVIPQIKSVIRNGKRILSRKQHGNLARHKRHIKSNVIGTGESRVALVLYRERNPEARRIDTAHSHRFHLRSIDGNFEFLVAVTPSTPARRSRPARCAGCRWTSPAASSSP